MYTSSACVHLETATNLHGSKVGTGSAAQASGIGHGETPRRGGACFENAKQRDGRKAGTGSAARCAKPGNANTPRRGGACPRFAGSRNAAFSLSQGATTWHGHCFENSQLS